MSPSNAHKVASTPSLSKTHLRLWLKMLKASKLIENELRERLRTEFGTTLPRFDVMAALDRSVDGLKMSKLSSELMVSNGNVTGIIDRLVKEEMVVRVPVEGDRRAMLVRLTEQGKNSFATMAEVHEQWVHELLVSVEVNEAQQTNDVFSSIEQNLENQGRADERN